MSDRKKENRKRKLKINLSIDAEVLEEKIVGKKEKWTNKRTDKPYVAILLYTVQPVIPDVCTKFQNPRSSSS